MTRVFITIDTELSASHFARYGKAGLTENFERAILGQSNVGDVGIVHQMDRLEAHGLKAVFFVDPMPALVMGNDVVKRIVHPILERGHDVQLHVHTEWLDFLDDSPIEAPIDGRTGRDIADFALADQLRIIAMARDQLMAAGAPEPVAFRAGNYGANDDTLRALAQNGLRFDSSFCPGLRTSACRINLPPDTLAPISHCGVMEVPLGAISSWGSKRRHAQLTALSAWEMKAAIAHALEIGQPTFSLVSHSFELIDRHSGRSNAVVARRFEQLCAFIASQPDITTGTYAHDAATLVPANQSSLTMPHSPVRTVLRVGEQIASNQVYSEAAIRKLADIQRILGERIVNPLPQIVPLQNLALDAISMI